MYTPDKPENIALLEEENSRQITQLLLDAGYPDKDSSTFLQIYKLSNFALRKSQITRLLDELTPLVTKSKNKDDIEKHRQNLRHILYALVASAYNFEWLAIPFGDSHYLKESRLGKLGFSRRRIQRIIKVLKSEGFIHEGRKGYLDPRNRADSKATQYYPNKPLLDYFSSCLYEFESHMELDSYHDFNDFPEGTLPNSTWYAENESLLKEYNLFMSNHWWAKKSPTTRSFSISIERGGRLNNAYQTIANRRLKIRTNTLLDGEPIAEPDFSANHLRMASAIIGEQLPDDPYQVISETTGASRRAVKAFVTRVLGATSKSQKGGQIITLYKEVKDELTPDLYRALLDTFYREYPWLKTHSIFFNDTGAKMQILEGEIGLKMFRWAIDTNTPVISVHDSFACKHYHQEQVWDAMQTFWDEVVNNRKATRRWLISTNLS